MGVTASDNGVYSCRAVNPAGQLDSTDNFILNVPGAVIRHCFFLFPTASYGLVCKLVSYWSYYLAVPVIAEIIAVELDRKCC